MSTSHQRNTRTRLESQFRNPPLLRDRSEPAWAATRSHFHPINHDNIVVLKAQVMPEGKTGRLLSASITREIKKRTNSAERVAGEQKG
ncbi:MAG: hypothetical protein WBE38_18205, partial [Terracidiphilus sp.]